MTRFLVSAAIALTMASSVQAAELSDEQFRQMAEKEFASAVKQYDVPGLVVGASIDGRHYVYTFGKTAREDGKPVDADTIFELGSVSKTFSVTLAALAAERGLLDLNAPVSTYIAETKGTAFGKIKLANLATHMSGGFPLQVPDTIKTNAELIDYLMKWKPEAEPDTLRSYSNVSIGMLGLITAKAMDTDYRNATETVLFPELGLLSTYVKVPDAAMGRYAFGYARTKNDPIRVNPGMLASEAYGVKSTGNDMLRFVDVQMNVASAPAEIKKAVRQTHTGYFKTEYYTQAMLWEQYPWPTSLELLLQGNSSKMVLEGQPAQKVVDPGVAPDTSFYNKTGSTTGFGSYVAFVPSSKIGIVMLSNRNFPNEDRVEATYNLIKAIEAVR